MSTEKHFNERSVLPDALEDNKPTDRKAARSLAYVQLATAAVVVLALLLFRAF